MERENVSIWELDFRKKPYMRTIIDRYVLVSDYCRGKTILSLGCGFGYGEMILKALGSKKIVGIDMDSEAIKYINENYKSYMQGIHKNLETDEVELHKKFDVILVMECIEHIKKENVKKVFDIIRRHISPNGIVIISTPIKTQEREQNKDILHDYEYSFAEFGDLLKQEFPEDKVGCNLLGEYVMSNDGFFDDQVTFRVKKVELAKTMVGLVFKGDKK